MFVLSISGLAAQSSEIDHLYNSCRGEEDVISLYIPGFLCRMGAALGGLDDVLILGREKEGFVSDLLIVVGGDENALISIKGRMNKDLLDALYEVTGIEECLYAKEI